MLNSKEKIIKFIQRDAKLLHLLLKGFSWGMCIASVLLILMGILFFITGDQHIFLHKRQLQCNQQINNESFSPLYGKNNKFGDIQIVL